MNSTQMITRLRQLLAVDDRLTKWTEEELYDYLNSSILQIYSKAVEQNPDYYLDVAQLDALGVPDATQISGSLYETTYPDNWLLIRRIETVNGNSFRPLPMEPSTIHQGIQGTSFGRFSVFQSKDSYLLAGERRIIFSSNPQSRDIRVWYVPQPPLLTRFKATGGTTTTIQISNINSPGITNTPELSPTANAYLGAKLRCTTATGGAAAPQGELVRVTDYSVGAYPAYTFTISPAFSVATEADDEFDSEPILDDPHHELIIYEAALRAMDKERNVPGKQVIQDKRNELYNQFLNTVVYRQDYTPRTINYIDRVD